ncbi:hypothetical protein BB561_000615 [Smittium simulii]|uniref:DH domain-containing protein n=1 Tax=Smittium simulii TaxID=133385 RepID=A0A2T9YYB1_9FUNG|nr:hypothetical protein BB561_000615 [Smittium simulii]
MDKHKVSSTNTSSQRFNFFNIDFGKSSSASKKPSSKPNIIPKISTPIQYEQNKLASPAVGLVYTFLNNLPTQNISYKNVTYNYAFSGKTAIDTISKAFKMPNRDACVNISQKIVKNNISYPLLSSPQSPFYIDNEDVFYILTSHGIDSLNSTALLLHHLSSKNKLLSITSTSPKFIKLSPTPSTLTNIHDLSPTNKHPQPFNLLVPRQETRPKSIKRSSLDFHQSSDSPTQTRSESPKEFNYNLNKVDIPQLELSFALKNYLTEDKSTSSSSKYLKFNNSRSNSIISSSKMLSNLDLNFGTGFKADLENELFPLSDFQSSSPSTDLENFSHINVQLPSPKGLHLLSELEHDQRVSDTTIIDNQSQPLSDYRKSLLNTDPVSSIHSSTFNSHQDKNVLYPFIDLKPSLSSNSLESSQHSHIKPLLISNLNESNHTNPSSYSDFFNKINLKHNNSTNTIEQGFTKMSNVSIPKLQNEYQFLPTGVTLRNKKSVQSNSKKSLLKQFGRSANDLKGLWSSSRISKDDYDISSPTVLSSVGISISRSISCEPKRPILWSHTIPKEELILYSSDFIKWQEAVYETIETEKDYLKDMKLIEKIYIEPLICSGCIKRENVDGFIKSLFLNYNDLIELNSSLCSELSVRQMQYTRKPLTTVSDIFVKWSENLDPFITYSIGVQLSQVALEAEMHINEDFAKFIYSTELNDLSRKLPIQSFLSRPTARFAKYPLLFMSILKHMPKKGYETEIANFQLVLERVKHALEWINELNSNQVKKLRLLRLSTQIKTTVEESEILDINNKNRELLLEDDFYCADGTVMRGFLFDNCFILATKKKVLHAKGITEYIVHRGPLPLMLLSINSEFSKESDYIHPLVPKKIGFGRLPTIIAKSSTSHSVAQYNNNDNCSNNYSNLGTNNTGMPVRISNNNGNFSKSNSRYSAAAFSTISHVSHTSHASNALINSNNNLKPGNMDAIANSVPMTFVMISKLGWELTLWAASANNRDLWIECVNSRVAMLNDQASKKLSFALHSCNLQMGFKAVCMAEYVSTTKIKMLMIGAADGIYLCQAKSISSMKKVCSLPNIYNIAVLSRYNTVIVLYDKIVIAIPLNELENTPNSNLHNKGTKLASSVTYFDVGMYFDIPLIVLMKYRNNKSYYKCLSPVEYDTSKEIENSTVNSSLVYQNTLFGLKIAHEFCVPGLSSKVFFFKKKLCIANGNCFDVIDLDNKVISQSLPRNLDSMPESSAMAIYRVNKLFLLCFEGYAIYIDRMGQQVFPDLVIHYLVKPVQFAFVYPNYLIIIGKDFIEIRYIDTGDLFLILRIPGVKCLNRGSHPLTHTPQRSGSNKKSIMLSMKSNYLPKSVRAASVYDYQESLCSYESQSDGEESTGGGKALERHDSNGSNNSSGSQANEENSKTRLSTETQSSIELDKEEEGVPLGKVSHSLTKAKNRLSRLSNVQMRTGKVYLAAVGSNRPLSAKSSNSKFTLGSEVPNEQNQYLTQHEKQNSFGSSNTNNYGYSDQFSESAIRSQSPGIAPQQNSTANTGLNVGYVQLRAQAQGTNQQRTSAQTNSVTSSKYNNYNFANSTPTGSVFVNELYNDYAIVEMILP